MTPRLRVSDFLAVVNQSLDMAFGAVEVEGEVASFKVNHQKYVFFDLKDDAGTVNCFMTVWQLRTPIEDGMRVVVAAVPKVTNWGKFSLTVQAVRPVGEGNLRRSFELLRKKLTDEGLFDPARKRSLPEFPKKVAVISSTQAAGYADFMKIAQERWGGVRFVVAHVPVQGQAAAEQIEQAIKRVEQLPNPPEVIVLIRGGGSADDLSVFNDELLVRAVASSRVPVLTGIGHEVDESLCDLAADVRASTPSNAAQLLLPDKHETVRRVRQAVQGAKSVALRTIDQEVRQLQEMQREALAAWLQQTEYMRQTIQARQAVIREYDPELVLQRGYALVRGRQAVGEQIEIITKQAMMKARVETYEKRTDN